MAKAKEEKRWEANGKSTGEEGKMAMEKANAKANGKSTGEEGQAREVTDALRVIFQSSSLFR